MLRRRGKAMTDAPAPSFYQQTWEHPHLTPSIARTLAEKTPRHAQLECPYFGPVKRKPSAAMNEGSIVGGDPGVTVLDYEKYNTNEARAARDAAVNPIKRADYERCEYAADAVLESLQDDARKMLVRGVKKERLFWESNGVYCSAEPDIHDGDVVLDLKRTKIVPHVANWERHAYKMRYGLQVAATLEATGADKFGWIIIEADWPHLSVVHWASPVFIKVARDDWKLAKDTWANCLECNYFHGYESGVIEPMTWQLADDDAMTFTD